MMAIKESQNTYDDCPVCPYCGWRQERADCYYPNSYDSIYEYLCQKCYKTFFTHVMPNNYKSAKKVSDLY